MIHNMSQQFDTSFGLDENVQVEQNLLLAIPKKGRLNEKCMALLEGAGIEFYRPNRLDVAKCTSLPITIVFLPAAGNVNGKVNQHIYMYVYIYIYIYIY
jgi:hypothetical protein